MVGSESSPNAVVVVVVVVVKVAVPKEGALPLLPSFIKSSGVITVTNFWNNTTGVVVVGRVGRTTAGVVGTVGGVPAPAGGVVVVVVAGGGGVVLVLVLVVGGREVGGVVVVVIGGREGAAVLVLVGARVVTGLGGAVAAGAAGAAGAVVSSCVSLIGSSTSSPALSSTCPVVPSAASPTSFFTVVGGAGEVGVVAVVIGVVGVVSLPVVVEVDELFSSASVAIRRRRSKSLLRLAAVVGRGARRRRERRKRHGRVRKRRRGIEEDDECPPAPAPCLLCVMAGWLAWRWALGGRKAQGDLVLATAVCGVVCRAWTKLLGVVTGHALLSRGGDFLHAWTWIEGGQDCRVRSLWVDCVRREESKGQNHQNHTYRGQEKDKDKDGLVVWVGVRLRRPPPPHFFYFSSGSLLALFCSPSVEIRDQTAARAMFENEKQMVLDFPWHGKTHTPDTGTGQKKCIDDVCIRSA